jgi:hypothetical protein
VAFPGACGKALPGVDDTWNLLDDACHQLAEVHPPARTALRHARSSDCSIVSAPTSATGFIPARRIWQGSAGISPIVRR